ncbi:hypothetical protein [Mycolicibacterium phlei]|jgi:hypothetical protein
MGPTNDPPATPLDATKVTEQQRDLQELLNHQHDDPEAPGRHQDRHDVAGEN